MAETLISNRSGDLWSEVKPMIGRSRKSAYTIDGMNGDKDIADRFSDKYNTLYNYFPFDNNDMLHIRSTIDHRLQNTRCSGYVIAPEDVRIAVDHFKSGKGDGFEGLCSDHVFNGTNILYVFFIYYIHFNFLSHGFIPDSWILGTMIPIPKDKNKYFCSS